MKVRFSAPCRRDFNEFGAGKLRRDVPVGRHEFPARQRDKTMSSSRGAPAAICKPKLLVRLEFERPHDAQRIGTAALLRKFVAATLVGIDGGGDIGVGAAERH